MNKGQFKLYTASAGSGKTYTLVREFLTLSLSYNKPSCKDILAVTFTNKAANEMKAKILSQLDGFINNDPKCDGMKNDIIAALNIDEAMLVKRAEALYEDILHNYSDFSISTIDSFIQQVSRSFSKELNLPAQYKVLLDDDDLLDGLIQKVDAQIDKDDKSITEILMDFLEFQMNDEDSLRIDVLLRDFVKKILKESAYKKGELLELKEFSENDYQKLKESLNDLHDKCKENVLQVIPKIRDFEAKYGIESVHYSNGLKGLPSMLNKIEKDIAVRPSLLVGKTIKGVLSRDKDWFSKKLNKQTIDAINRDGVDVVDMYKELAHNHAKYFLVDIVRKNLYLYALRGMLLDVINQYIGDTNKVHISEFNKRISDILGDCSIPFIYEKIGSRYKHFFIDEFQDTSILQWHNFLPLVNNGLSENNMSLLVGDAKQAIYRFRSGEVEQIINLPSIYAAEKNEFYAECEETFKSRLHKESLECNYRSKKNIIEFNNSFFKLSKNKLTSEDYRKVYFDLEQKCPKEYPYEGFVSVEIFNMENLANDETEKSTKLYKDAVKEAILKDINILKDKGFSMRDISILVRNNSDGAEIADFLSQKNIPVISSDSILLKSSDKVRLVILTLKFLLDDKNDVTKLTLSYYKNLCEDIASCDIHKALKNDIDFDMLYDVRNKAYSIYDLCCAIIKMYGFNIVEDEFLQYFMNHVLEWQNSENAGIDAFVEHWDRKSNEMYVKLSAEIDAVQIMTIHKSKGLEFKVVMYPYAFTKVPNKFRGDEIWLSSDNFGLLKDIPNLDSYILPVNKSLLNTDMEGYYKDELKKSAFDDFNIMYVGMTRASDLMFVYTNDEMASSDDENTVEPYNFFLEYFNSDDVVERFNISHNDTSVKYELGDILYFKDKKEADSKIILELKEDDIPDALEWKESLDFEPDPTMYWAADDGSYGPQEWGNLVHDIMSKINTIEDADKVLTYYINEGSIDSQQARKLREQFEKIVGIDEIKDAYSKDAIVKNEMDILIYDRYNGNTTVRPDRYAELDDKVILIDYKTGKHHEKYYEQLKNYMVALKDMGVEKDIEAYLLYIGENIETKPVFLDRLF